MKLRLTQSGFESYSGQMGVVMFEDGLSIDDVLTIDGIRIAAAIGAQWEDGSAANVGDMYLDNMNTPAFLGDFIESPADENEPAPTAVPSSEKPETAVEKFTKKQLAKIADEEGVAGLRKIGDTLGVKGKSIVELIDLILQSQQKS